MPSQTTQQFIEALHRTEDGRDPSPLVELFANDAELTNPARSTTERGREGAHRFWSDYLSAFEQVHSDFKEVHEADGLAVLEWTSTGRLPNGKEIRYDGVSLLELDNDRVRKFRTYYDSAAFTTPGSSHTH